MRHLWSGKLSGLAALTFVVACSLSAGEPAFGDFTLVDNFENYTPGSAGVDITTQSGSGYTGTSGAALVRSEGSVPGAQSNVLQLNGNSSTTTVGKTSAFTIATGTTATLFFQYLPDPAYNGASQNAQIGVTDSVGGFNERAGFEANGSYGEALDNSGTPFALTNGTLVNVWVVIHNGTGTGTYPDSYDLYAQSGSGMLSTIATGVQFRLPGDHYNGNYSGALTAFNLSQYSNLTFAVDNVYVDTNGQDLSDPVPEPSSVAMVVGGSALLLRRRRCRS